MNSSKDKIESIHNSLQIWYEGKQNSSGLEMDVNVWRLKGKIKREIFLDFGLKVLCPEDVCKIFIYFPFLLDKGNLISLGKQMENDSLLNGIFNENYVISTKAKNISVIEENSIKEAFSIYQLDIEKDITIENVFSGTVVSFIVKHKNNTPRYYRFRVQARKYGTLFERYKPKNSFFESAFIETEIIDFRINEKRNQDNGLVERIDENQKFKIKVINFFVMSPIQDEIDSDGINLVYKRQLEMGNFWGAYLSRSYNRMSVYKCKTKDGISPIENFNCFCKIKYRKSNFFTIFIYLVVLFFLTIGFDFLSNMLWQIF